MILVGWALAAAALDRYGRRRTTPSGFWDAIVVAGCHVRPDGEPTRALSGRVEKAVELYRAGLAERLVLTGGVGPNPPAEAIVAAKLAKSLGVPDEAILIEDRSISTDENGLFAHKLLDGRRVIVVSDSYHVLRCERVFSRYFDAVHGAGSLSPLDARIVGSCREVVALTWYALTGRLALSSAG